MLIINDRNLGRDATIDPAYLAHTKDESEDMDELKRDVAELQEDSK